MTVTVFGLGFVGLTTAIGLASKGHQVYGYDIDLVRRDTIAAGRLPFLEPGLDEALAREIGVHFHLTDNPADAVQKSECVFFCVGTPYGENGQANLNYLFAAMDQALAGADEEKFRVFVVKSTVPPTTISERVIPYLQKHSCLYGRKLGVANNPEFLREGHCWDDFMNADRIVLGVCDVQSEQLLKELYQGFNCPIFVVSPNTGEFIKYLSNCLLATLISFSNEMSILANVVGDVEIAKAFHILHLDKRWNNCNMTTYVYPGCGYGGYCLPKDTNALLALSEEKGFEPGILKQVIHTNDTMPQQIAARIMEKTHLTDRIAILGLSFKADSDDVRQSPAVPVLRVLQKNGYRNMTAFDPVANDMFQKTYPDIALQYKSNLEDALQDAECAVILTAWQQFTAVLEYPNIKVIDCRYMLP